MAAVAAVAASLVAAVLMVAGSGSSGGDNEAGDYDAKVRQAFQPLTDELPKIIQEGQKWLAGTTPAADYAALLAAAAPRADSVPSLVAALPRFDPAPEAGERYLASARLLAEFVHLQQVAVVVADEPLRSQVELTARRVRTLGDRVFDRARAAVDPTAYEQDPSGLVDVRHVPEVPDWAADGLAAGPPLDDPPPPPAEQPSEREATRPEQSEAAWRKAVRAVSVPAATRVAEAVTAGDGPALQALARRLTEAATRLQSVADPEGDRDRAAVVRLGLLVHAEAARVAQVAGLAGDAPWAGRLRALAPRLILIGDTLWDKALPERRSGLDPALLEG